MGPGTVPKTVPGTSPKSHTTGVRVQGPSLVKPWV